MQPKSLSATALNTFQLCPARYQAEAYDRSKGFGSVAASVGSTVHGALEMFVKACYLGETREEPTLELLISFLKLSYLEVFNSHDTSTPEYLDAWEILCKWHKRVTDNHEFDDIEVISCEVKTNFEVPTSIGNLPFNYIWDRFDKIGERTYRVVDYKTNRWGLQPSQLKKKIQARAYGLAAAIQLKRDGIEWDRIWVEFDMLRHAGPVGISFSREENAATWRFIKDSAQEIVDTADTEIDPMTGEPRRVILPERLNPECLFCVRKAECGALKKNIMVGGIFSIQSIEEVIDVRAQIEWQKKGLESLLGDLDNRILTEAKERDIHEFESDINKLVIGASSRRTVDAEMVRMAVGDDLFEKYGEQKMTIGQVDKMLKSKDLTDEQKKSVRSLIYRTTGNPTVKIEPKNPIDGD